MNRHFTRQEVTANTMCFEEIIFILQNQHIFLLHVSLNLNTDWIMKGINVLVSIMRMDGVLREIWKAVLYTLSVFRRLWKLLSSSRLEFHFKHSCLWTSQKKKKNKMLCNYSSTSDQSYCFDIERICLENISSTNYRQHRREICPKCYHRHWRMPKELIAKQTEWRQRKCWVAPECIRKEQTNDGNIGCSWRI